MIPNHWYVLMESRQVKEKSAGVTRMGEKLVFWRDDAGKVSCLRDKCAHRGIELSKGQVVGRRSWKGIGHESLPGQRRLAKGW